MAFLRFGAARTAGDAGGWGLEYFRGDSVADGPSQIALGFNDHNLL